MASKRVQPVCIGCGDQRFVKARRHFCRPSIWVEETLVKMAKLNRIETIYFFQQPGAN